jgi:3-hydroxyisobutyrate dehydrogenase-like beta-hydroxyacid dehydrogenase
MPGDPAMTTVALLGTGRMGSAMARSLARAGVPLVLWNRTPASAQALAADIGARHAATPAEAARGVDVAITMLADDEAVREVFAGPNGLVAGVRPGAVLVDMSTVLPHTIRSLETAVRATGAGILDSPVSGSVGLAETGRLTLMVGGEADDLEVARAALEPLAATIVHVGPLGSGAALKLAVNTVIFGLNHAIAEALVLAEAAGVDRATAYDVLAASAVGAPFVGYKRAAFLEPETTPVAFGLDLAQKDLRLIAALASEVGVPTPQAAINLAEVRAAAAEGRGGLDFSTVAEHLRRRTAQPPTAADGGTAAEG